MGAVASIIGGGLGFVIGGPAGAAAGASIGASVGGGISAKQSADKAAARANNAAEFNAQIIERDIGLLTKGRDILNANFAIDFERSTRLFERDVQGTAKAGFGYAGVDMSQGTPIQILRENAREFDYQMSVQKFDTAVENMQIDDAIEETRLNAQLARMEGGATAASLRSQGTQSLISGLGSGARDAFDMGLFE
tara:strand:- start:63 stop:644 length:582 start_codon:yes stop_codon:yes gene_type:complete